jgi:hypothetical protein
MTDIPFQVEIASESLSETSGITIPKNEEGNI